MAGRSHVRSPSGACTCWCTVAIPRVLRQSPVRYRQRAAASTPIWATPYHKRILSADGHELRFAVNYLAPALLARRLVASLKNGEPARIVNVASAGQAPISFADLRMDHHYAGTRAYYHSKFALVAFTFDLAAEVADNAITVNCLHPAWLMNTHMVRKAWVPPMSSIATGVRAVMNLAVEPTGAAVTVRYFDGLREARAHGAAYDPAIRSNLRAVTNEILEPFL